MEGLEPQALIRLVNPEEYGEVGKENYLNMVNQIDYYWQSYIFEGKSITWKIWNTINYNKYLIIKELGICCEKLIPGDPRGWVRGKIKINMWFEPDEPESPLDELRDSL
ncbi:MAG: KGK domain-containing protein [Pseudanabaenaceae cyanobacterium SKYGB_i_bin29]|nr:hypothetical protein [Pseudanabaenaceae cyanobacterium SKYG29]MDW8420501.1 KGK domain-containing protein [Pseudanabaenaceae cyanobacterium SKYGB_i_bin29]